MPHDRRSRRTSLIMIGVVSAAVPIGCMRSSNVRPGGGPLPELSPAGQPQTGSRTFATPGQDPANGSPSPAPTGQPARAALPPEPSPVATDPTVFQTGAPSAGSATPRAGTEAATEPQPATVPAPPGEAPKPDEPPASTPLLDAEITRVEAVTRQYSESLHANDPSELPAQPSLDPPARPILDLTLAKPAEPTSASSVTPTPKPAPADAVESPAEPAQLPIFLSPMPAGPFAPESNRPAPAVRADDGAPPTEETGPEPVDNRRPDPSKDEELAAKEDSSPAIPDRPQLGIAELRLCDKVLGFGSFEPLDPNALKPGQVVKVYWEMTGLQYEARGDGFLTRLSCHFELRPEGGGPSVWEQSPPTAVDVCRRRRRDNYVNCRITLPRSLEPGPYRFRLIQTDLVAGRTTSAEVPLTIVP
jgi:hypothetical protein